MIQTVLENKVPVKIWTKDIEEEATRQQQRKLLNTMRRRRFTPPKGTPDVTAMLREDRRR